MQSFPLDSQIDLLETQLAFLKAQQIDLNYGQQNRYPFIYQNNIEEGSPMTKGHIRTKQRCSECGGRFIDTTQLMVCGDCLKKQKIVIPDRFYLDVPWNGEKYKIYSDNDGEVLKYYEQAKQLLAEIRQRIKKHTFDPKDFTAKNYKALQFSNYTKTWLERYEILCTKDEIAPGTLKVVKMMANRYFIPFFNQKDLRDIKTADVEDFFLSLSSKLSQNTVKNILGVLHKLFSDAKRRRDIKDNTRE